MEKVAVVYHSYRGVTPKLVEALKKGVEEAGGQCETLLADDAAPEDVLAADVIVLACGQPFNAVPGPVKTFLEKCWIYEGKEKLAGKKYLTVINGSKDPKDVIAYLDNILPYFKLEKAEDGLACVTDDLDSALKKCYETGKKLVQGT